MQCIKTATGNCIHIDIIMSDMYENIGKNTWDHIYIQDNSILDIECPYLNDFTLLMHSAFNMRNDLVEWLIKMDVNVNIQRSIENRGFRKCNTALMSACYHGSPQSINALVNAGAKILLKDSKGETALEKALYNATGERDECIDAILDCIKEKSKNYEAYLLDNIIF